MANIQISVDTDLSPDLVMGAITDFSPRRLTLWRNIDPGAYKVHEVGTDWADVTEGTKVAGGVWTRERYDWSVPGVVRATVQESNIFKSGFWEMRVTAADGLTHVEIHQDRQAKGLKGSLVGAMMSIIGTRVYKQGINDTLAALRAEQGGEPSAA